MHGMPLAEGLGLQERDDPKLPNSNKTGLHQRSLHIRKSSHEPFSAATRSLKQNANSRRRHRNHYEP
jgi:hypothetical protein